MSLAVSDTLNITGSLAPESFSKTMRTLMAVLQASDPYTFNHSQFVCSHARLISQSLGIPPGECELIAQAALLHDIGKVSIPSVILNKPAPLSHREYTVMKQHAEAGAHILEASGLTTVATWVRHHHERIDGAGYPGFLKGDEIPLASRIILVSDALDAMTSNRPYRQALGASEAALELERGAGSQFDASIVQVCLDLLDRGELELACDGPIDPLLAA